MAKITQLDERSIAELNRLFKKVDTLSGDGVTNSTHKIVIKRGSGGGGRRRGGGGPQGGREFMGQDFTMLTNNVPGWDEDIWLPSK
jgi:hypothetical protein